MSGSVHRLLLGLKALRELGLTQLSLYTIYQLGLRSGYYRRLTPPPSAPRSILTLRPILRLPGVNQLADLLDEQALTELKDAADEIVAGKVRLFGSHPVPVELSPPAPLLHWTAYETNPHDLGDLKLIWEPARFSWVFILGRAYLLTQNEAYPQAFWDYFEAFQATNPPYLGPSWISGQEAALRLVAFIFAAQLFSTSPHSTPSRQAQLAEAVAQHATRIPPTLVYARAQNNNHLISESIGLCSAAAALPDHPSAHAWGKLGWRWLNHALQTQIAPDGTYSQHSTNYHRLMLQAALWAFTNQRVGDPAASFSPRSTARLQAAVTWLLALLDPHTGQVPNLGPNDGAYIFPLTSLPYADYRPVVQAAARAFLARPALPPGPWDEMGLWFDLPLELPSVKAVHASAGLGHPSQTVLRGAQDSWAYLRIARFTSRPGHSDQLHLDLWRGGLNLTLDPGTYHYTAALPWDNALSSALVHNTITIDGQDPMTRAGRFLFLDWAQAQVTARGQDPVSASLTGQHDGYRRFGIIHQRQVTAALDGSWLVEDTLTGPAASDHTARLHWLVPDWPWEPEVGPAACRLKFTSPQGLVKLTIQAAAEQLGQAMSLPLACSLVRAGELVLGPGPSHPTWGWTSPTYSDKIPALAVVIEVNSQLPLHLTSQWSFTDEKS